MEALRRLRVRRDSWHTRFTRKLAREPNQQLRAAVLGVVAVPLAGLAAAPKSMA